MMKELCPNLKNLPHGSVLAQSNLMNNFSQAKTRYGRKKIEEEKFLFTIELPKGVCLLEEKERKEKVYNGSFKIL